MLRLLQKFAEVMAVAFLAAMFAAFLLQIVTRYVLNNPLGWTSEACVILYIWAVFWTSAFVIGEKDHVAFTMISDVVSSRTRRVFRIIGYGALALAFATALPGIASYVHFMKIDVTPVTRIRFDIVYSVFPLFAAAVAIRSVIALWRAIRGVDDQATSSAAGPL